MAKSEVRKVELDISTANHLVGLGFRVEIFREDTSRTYSNVSYQSLIRIEALIEKEILVEEEYPLFYGDISLCLTYKIPGERTLD